MSSSKPNILFVFSDQHRWCDLGCYGNSEVKTPAFDAFAAESVRFNHCISNSPLCVPARGSLLTGLYPLRHGAITNDLPVNTAVTSLGNVLKEGGYRTGYIGKWHLAGVPREQTIPTGAGRLGFDYWKVNNCEHSYLTTKYFDEQDNGHPIDGYEPTTQTDLAMDFIRSGRNTKNPWGLVLSWGPPHDPYREVPDRFLKLYEEDRLTMRINVSFPVLNSREHLLGESDLRKNLQGYYAHISALDHEFSRLLEILGETDQLDNTIIVYTSDHGDMLGSHGLTNKQLPYDESIRVPLLVKCPGVEGGRSINELIGLVDLPVSLAACVGLDFPGKPDGKDLHRLLLEEGAKGSQECYIFDYVPAHQAWSRGGEAWRGLRTERYTLVRNADGKDSLLFDNESDPLQLNNLIENPDYSDVCTTLAQRLSELIAEHDCMLCGDEFIRRFGLTEEWNRSQAYFSLPLLQ